MSANATGLSSKQQLAQVLCQSLHAVTKDVALLIVQLAVKILCVLHCTDVLFMEIRIL